MNRQQNRARLVQALDLITLAADSYQRDLQTRITESATGGGAGLIGIGAMLALSRDVETLERMQRELAALLDSRSLRPVPSGCTAQHAAA